MKLAYVITRGDSIGGAQIHVRDLARHFASRGHEVTVIMGAGGALETALSDTGVRTTIVPTLVREPRLGADLAALRDLRRTLRETDPSLVSTHSSKAGALGRLAARSLGIPCLFTAHGWAFTDGVPPLRRTAYFVLESGLAPMSRAIVCVSHHDRELASHVPWVRSRLVTIHNSVHDVRAGLRASAEASPPHAVMIGRLDEQKDHGLLLRSLARVPNLTVDLIGDGPQKPEVSALAARLGLTDRVRFLGQRTDVAELLARAQLFVLASRWEGLPRSIIEAMRAGLPVVASDVGGVRELVEPGTTGTLVRRGAEAQLTEALRRYANDSALRVRHGEAGRARYAEHFTFDRLVRETEAVYDRALGGAFML